MIKKKNFKYYSSFKEISNCPPDDYYEDKIKAFRWVYEPIENKENFRPQILKNPKRFNDKEDKEKCLAYSLSFFETLKAAEERFNFFFERYNNKAYKIFGTHVAEGKLESNDGLRNDPDKKKHFSFHEYKRAKLIKKFKIVKKL
jgi:hypothetical protein